MPGVVDIPQGAWYEPEQDGVDHGGNVNVLTSHRWTPFAFGTAQHTIMVEIEKYNKRPRKKTWSNKKTKNRW
jgi:anaerobic dimethyl sulfoxide reductase subunit A